MSLSFAIKAIRDLLGPKNLFLQIKHFSTLHLFKTSHDLQNISLLHISA
jgi:hypothetical protein